LDDEDLVRMGRLLLVAGHDTTTMMISLAVLTTLTDPTVRAVFEAGGDRVDRAVEELLRFLTIVHFGLARRVAEDTEFQGVQLSAGDLVVVSLASANRDPRMYAHPDVLD